MTHVHIVGETPESEKLAEERLYSKLHELLGRPLRIDPRTRDISDNEKERIRQHLLAIGIQVETVTFNRYRGMIDWTPDVQTVNAEDIIMRTNPVDLGVLSNFKKKP